jgi:1-acyl-sn-glycerol-3-phosphate acyltransferase
MLLRRLQRATLIALHLTHGVGELYRTGGHREPFHPQVRTAMQRWYARMLRILGVEVSVVGELPHESATPCMMIANHISWLDIPLIGSQTPVNFLSKAEVAQWPGVGWLASRIGTLFIERGSGDTDHVMKSMARHLDNRLSVLFFPEGTTTDGKKLRRFHKKLFKVCEHTEVTVCPLVIHYRSEGEHNPVPFIGEISFGSHFWQLLGHKKLHATIEVLPSVSLMPETAVQQIREVEQRMRETLSRIAH